MVKVLGKWMSPMLLLVLLVLIGFGVVGAGGAASGASNNDAFVEGFLTGYQTMDLFAALWFSSLIFGQIHSALKSGKDDKEILSFAIKSSVVGSSLLCLVYFGLVYLGAHYAEILEGVSPERMLPAIVNNVMGDFATIFLAVVMVLSCLTTAVALNNIYARYLCELFRFSENRFPQVLFVTTAVSFVISLLNFKSIAAFLAPALDVSYPGLIALTILSTITRKHKPLKIAVFWGITLATAVYLLV
jgi:LIVCS family branched-chain amino acid:cation transporter